MVDNVAVTEGSGKVIRTDDVGGAQYQIVKLGWGADGVGTDVVVAAGLPTQSQDIGYVADAAWSGSGNGTLNAILKRVSNSLAAGIGITSTVALAAGTAFIGSIGGVTANPSQTFTRPADTTAYAANDLVANATAAGSVAYGTIAAARISGGSFQIDRLRLTTNHTTGLASKNVRVRLWTAAPTYTNGDNGGYVVATGAAGYLGSYTGAFEQFADGATAILSPDVASVVGKLSASANIFWDIQTLDIFTPQSAKTFTLFVEAQQD